MRLITVLALLFATSPVHAASWVKISTDQTGTKLFVDMDSIHRTGDIVTAWVNAIKSPRKVAGKSIKDRTHEAKEIWNFNCEYKTSQTSYYVAYDKFGNSIFTDNSTSPYEPVIPDSVGEKVMGFLCKSADGSMK